MRRLPIYLVVDVSESMAGEPIKEVQAGIEMLLKTLMTDPYAIETAYISVIAFAGQAKVLEPLTSVVSFICPELPIGAGTNFSSALNLLMGELDRNIVKNSPERKGDWKPIIYFLTDGAPNDNADAAILQWKQKYSKYTTIGVLMGGYSNASALKKLTDNVLIFKDTSEDSYKEFFKFVSSSIQVASAKIAENGMEPKSEFDRIKENIKSDLLTDSLPIENKFEYFVGVLRCQKTKKPFIRRYVREKGNSIFSYDGTYPIEESYFSLSEVNTQKQINAELLSGCKDKCPYCGNSNFGLDEKDNWLCLDSKSLYNVTSPWTGSVCDYTGSTSHLSGGNG